jgi:hypothetical protein
MRLDTLLAAAARSSDWERLVVHRCAWCSRVADSESIYRVMPNASRSTATTDGMCPACAATALAQLAARKKARSLVRAV